MEFTMLELKQLSMGLSCFISEGFGRDEDVKLKNRIDTFLEASEQLISLELLWDRSTMSYTEILDLRKAIAAARLQVILSKSPEEVNNG
jgi:hypothetical protein